MSSRYFFTLFLFNAIHLSKAQTNFTTTTASSDVYCSSNYAFVFLESSLSTLSETVLSERTNYPPYSYNNSILNTRVSLYAHNEIISEFVNNPCDSSTWSTASAYYDNTVVLITYNPTYAMLCNPQQWTLNLQRYANIKAVLIANDDDLTSVYPLSGDTGLPDPVIPTRMISKNTATKIRNTIVNISRAQDIFAAIDCYNDTSHPRTICMLDNSTIPVPKNVIIDGEYQRQSNILVNGHPVWLKEGHTGVSTWTHSDLYMWLTINHSSINNPWRWVIGTDYNNDATIDLECIQNTTDYIDDPTLCGNNWYRNDTQLGNMSSHGGICDTGDIYICVETIPGSYFQTSFSGRYRQIHKNVGYYVSQTAAEPTIFTIYRNLYGFGYYWWVFTMGYGAEAYCLITSQEIVYAPWSCNGLWYVWNPTISDYDATNHFDVDECSHPNITVNDTISYPQRLCLRDPTHSTTFYESYHGIYTLDETQQFDNRFVYKNQRLNSSSFDLYLIFVDEYDSWVINEQVPPVEIPTVIEGYCDDNVFTPDLCTDCWVFLRAFGDEIVCGIDVIVINDTMTESQCIGRDISIRIHAITNYTPQVTACFDDGNVGIYSNEFTGIYTLEPNMTYNERAVWSMQSINAQNTYYVYYSERWKYWVMDTVFQDPLVPSWSMICLVWDTFEPWNCSQWYSQTDASIAMTTQCTLPPTSHPTQVTLDPTQDTLHPTSPPSQKVIYDDILCFVDHDLGVTHYSQYQGLFGIYLLDQNRLFNDKPIYSQQRLQRHALGDWYMLYFDERDAWVINDYIPYDPHGSVAFYESICDQYISKPNDCTNDWDFYHGYQDVIGSSNARVIVMDTNDENKCIQQPQHDVDQYEFTEIISLCFDNEALSGEYNLGHTLYDRRHFWYRDNPQKTTLYLYYDEPTRFWVIDDTLGDVYVSVDSSHKWFAYCLLWDNIEPFNCTRWYYYEGYNDSGSRREMYSMVSCPVITDITNITTTDDLSSSDESGNPNKTENGAQWMGWLIGGGVFLCYLAIGIAYYLYATRRRRGENRGIVVKNDSFYNVDHEGCIDTVTVTVTDGEPQAMSNSIPKNDVPGMETAPLGTGGNVGVQVLEK